MSLLPKGKSKVGGSNDINISRLALKVCYESWIGNIKKSRASNKGLKAQPNFSCKKVHQVSLPIVSCVPTEAGVMQFSLLEGVLCDSGPSSCEGD